MLDEPSAGLSPKLVEGVFARLARDSRERRRDRAGRAERPRGARHRRSRIDSGGRAQPPRRARRGIVGRRARRRALSRRRAARESAIRRRRGAHGRHDRPRRDRRDAHLFDSAFRQFRARRIHRLGRLFRASRCDRPGLARRRLFDADRAVLVRLGPDPRAHRCDAADGRARARPRLGAVRATAREGEQHHDRDRELRRLDGAAQPARIPVHLAPRLFQPRIADRDAARLGRARHA